MTPLHFKHLIFTSVALLFTLTTDVSDLRLQHGHGLSSLPIIAAPDNRQAMRQH